MKGLGIDEKTISPKHVRERISRCKDQLQTSVQVERQEADEEDAFFIPIYQRYEEKLRYYNGVDFGDLIAKTVQLFSTVPEVLEHYRQRFP